EQYKNLGGNYINANVVSIKQDMKERLFEVKTSKELYFCKSLILCTGSNEKNKTLPELEDYEGTNVSYCAVCDGFFYKGKTVAVIGDGDFAINECEELSRVVEKIYLIAGKEAFLPNLKNVEVVNKKIVDVEGENMVERLVFEDKTKLAVDGVFVALGTMSSSDIAKRLGIVGNGGISVDKNYMTNISGVFAGGDAIGGLFQAAKAVSDGAYAGLGAAKYVKMMEFYSGGEE
ncbi:MAG: FAD-dependent oxidoreductase, partial [Clostridia bacterium]|nr:FAD-dependent oxidoreductase [Clostridia bacterium]